METRTKIFLGGLFGILLGLAYAPFPTGIFAFVAFIPLFIVFEKSESYGSLLRFSYCAFFLYNLITIYWPGGFTHGKDTFLMLAGAILLLAHPMFYFVPIAAWAALRRRIGFEKALYFFPFFWVAFEYLDGATDFAFPWLTLGTTQAADLPAIQFASVTGVHGVSFWILAVNIGTFFISRKVSRKEWALFSGKTLLALGCIIVLYALPRVYGAYELSRRRSPATSLEGSASTTALRLGILQPNIDPFEKWDRPVDPQVRILQGMTNALAQEKPELLLWPETAVPYYLLDGRHSASLALIRRQVDSLRIPLLSGVPDIIFYRDSVEAPPGSKRTPVGTYYESFNSSVLFQPDSAPIQKYAKMLLVPFAERVPYSDFLSVLNAAKWNFGMGGWNKGRDATVFTLRLPDGRQVRFSTMICYESIFPGFVARFVREGAQFLTVITNDSWWGNTSGPYQHIAIEAFRAVENRRWLVQCSNGGISCCIDPTGEVRSATEMFTRTSFVATVVPGTELTFYSRYGDWFAAMCLWIAALAVVGAAVSDVYVQRRRKDIP